MMTDREYYHRCRELIKPLADHVKTGNLKEDMLKVYLDKGVQRIEKWINDEIKNIERLEKNNDQHCTCSKK